MCAIGLVIDPFARWALAFIFFVAALAKGPDFASVSAVTERVLGVDQAFGRLFMGVLIVIELALASALAGGILKRASIVLGAILGVAFVSWNLYLKIGGINDCGCGVSDAMRRLMGYGADSLLWSVAVLLLSFLLLAVELADSLSLLRFGKAKV